MRSPSSIKLMLYKVQALNSQVGLMEYRVVFDCPDRKAVIDKLLNAAAEAGAGTFGNYSRAALVIRGYGTWKSEKGAHPNIGRVGRISRVPSARIEMSCPRGRLRAVCRAIRKAHPYEEPVIYCVEVRYG